MIVWIASYPKSGNTWMRAFLSSYFMTENGIFDVKKLDAIPNYPQQSFFGDKIIPEGEIFKFWESSQKKIIETKKIKFLKTHNALIKKDNFEFTYPKFVLGIIYIIRDPRNVITSIKNHNGFESYEETFEYMKNIRAIETKEINKSFSSYSYVTSWKMHYESWNNSKNYRILTIKYEDMLNEPYKTFRDVIVFINAICKFNNRVNENKIMNSINSTNFDSLKKIEENGTFNENAYIENKNLRPKFFFLGGKNNWKNLLTEKIKNEMNEYYKQDLLKFDYEKN